MTMPLRRYSVDLNTRAAQRKQRLLDIEKEQRIEEAEALKMTEEQHQTLLRSFSTVKVEFSDLDGLSWKEATRYPTFNADIINSREHRPLPLPLSSPSSHNNSASENTFVILTSADLETLSPEDTIRASASRPFYNNPLHRHTAYSRDSLSPSPSPSPSSSLSRALSFKNLKTFTFKQKRHRLPLKGLFPSTRKDGAQGHNSDSDGDVTVCIHKDGKEPTTSKRKGEQEDVAPGSSASRTGSDPPGLSVIGVTNN